MLVVSPIVDSIASITALSVHLQLLNNIMCLAHAVRLTTVKSSRNSRGRQHLGLNT